MNDQNETHAARPRGATDLLQTESAQLLSLTRGSLLFPEQLEILDPENPELYNVGGTVSLGKCEFLKEWIFF